MRACTCEGGSAPSNDGQCGVCRLSPQRPKPIKLPPFAAKYVKPPGDTSHVIVKLDSAFNKQEGGDHYKDRAIQPFHFVRRNNIPHAEGECIYKLLRWREKGGIADLEKVIHTIQLIIEEEKGTHG